MAPEMKIVKDNPNVSNWISETGYKSEWCGNDYPIRVFNARQDAALGIETRLSVKDLEYLCRGSIQGFKVFLSAPGESFKMSRDFYRVPLSENANIFIKPRLITTSKDLRSYKPKQRQCFYNSERQLRFYRHYSQRSCEMECLANFTMMECDCAKFSMPSKNRFSKKKKF